MKHDTGKGKGKGKGGRRHASTYRPRARMNKGCCPLALVPAPAVHGPASFLHTCILFKVASAKKEPLSIDHCTRAVIVGWCSTKPKRDDVFF